MTGALPPGVGPLRQSRRDRNFKKVRIGIMRVGAIRFALITVATFLALLASSNVGTAQPGLERLAIIVSIERYQPGSGLRPLPSARKDAALMRAAFKKLGYSTLEVPDGSWASVRRAIAADERVSRAKFIAFYFSGHGFFCCGADTSGTSTAWDDAPLLLFSLFQMSQLAGPLDASQGQIHGNEGPSPKMAAAAMNGEAITTTTVMRFLRSRTRAPLLFLVDACRNDEVVPRVSESIWGTLQESEAFHARIRNGRTAIESVTFYATTAFAEAAALSASGGGSPFTDVLASQMNQNGNNWPLTIVRTLKQSMEKHNQTPKLEPEAVVTAEWMAASGSAGRAVAPGSTLLIDSTGLANERRAGRWSSASLPSLEYNGTYLYHLMTPTGMGLSHHLAHLEFRTAVDAMLREADRRLGEGWRNDSSYAVEVEYPYDTHSCWWQVQYGASIAISNYFLEDVILDSSPRAQLAMRIVAPTHPAPDCNLKQQRSQTVTVRLLRRADSVTRKRFTPDAQGFAAFRHHYFDFGMDAPSEFSEISLIANDRSDGEGWVWVMRGADPALELHVEVGEVEKPGDPVQAFRSRLSHHGLSRAAYSAQMADYFVISDKKGSQRVFYECDAILKNSEKRRWVRFILTYPTSLAPVIEPKIPRMFKSFVGSARARVP